MNRHSCHIFNLILFDLGGTLFYFDGEWPNIYREACHALLSTLRNSGYHHLPPEFAEEFYHSIQRYYIARETDLIEQTSGRVLRGLMNQYGYLNISDEEIKQALARLYAVSQSHWRLEEDTISVLETLRQEGYHLGVISNAADNEDVQMLIDRSHIRKYFELILVSAAVGWRKPHPKMFELALAHFNILGAQAVMVGDTLDADIRGAKRMGISSVWITRRVDCAEFERLDHALQPDVAIETLSELPSLLRNWKI